MTKSEASRILKIPLSTLNDWEQSTHSKNTLFQFIVATDKNEVENKLNGRKSHRLFHILNRNNLQENYTYEDIQRAFLKDDYSKATQKERTIYAKFFKECDVDDLETLILHFGLSKQTIKKLYVTLPERQIYGVAKVWDRRFRLKSIASNQYEIVKNIPTPLANILQRKAALANV